MADRALVTILAGLIDARGRCAQTGNTEWYARHTEKLRYLAQNYLPSGSGVDCGTTIDLDASTGDKIVLTCSFHHMDDGGGYAGWTDHRITVRASLIHGFTLTISGRDRNQIKEYLCQLYEADLSAVIPQADLAAPTIVDGTPADYGGTRAD